LSAQNGDAAVAVNFDERPLDHDDIGAAGFELRGGELADWPVAQALCRRRSGKRGNRGKGDDDKRVSGHENIL
jgi:hypothetical protein